MQNNTDNLNTVKKCLVDVYFEEIEKTYTYYNNKFALKLGDIVFVDGKMEGIRGRVVNINYCFKIKLSDYKCVAAVADIDIHGELYNAGSHFMAFDPCIMPIAKIRSWFLAPVKEEDEFAVGTDDEAFELKGINGMKIDDTIFKRGKDYYINNRVAYICLDGSCGYAIIRGKKTYEVEFKYSDGMISDLTCSCFCNYNCKHQVAVMLQLRECLNIIEKNYAEQFRGYFAAALKGAIYSIVIDGREKGSIRI